MTVDSDYAETAFADLLDRNPAVRLTDVLAEISADLDRHAASFDFDRWLTDQADALRPAVLLHASPADQAAALFDGLASRHGLGQRDANYADFRSSVVRHVAQTGRGLPIVLCLIASEIGRRVGLSLRGVSSPDHFLLRTETDDGVVFFDAYRGGLPRSWEETTAWLSSATGYPAELVEPTLEPAKPRLVAIRVLENLKRQLVESDEWARAYTVQSRLLALRPSSRSDRRDLAAIAAQGPNPSEALRLLKSLVRDADTAEQDVLERIAKQARAGLISLN